MQRTPGKRDYGSSDCARLRNLASRGSVESPPASPPVRQEGPTSVKAMRPDRHLRRGSRAPGGT